MCVGRIYGSAVKVESEAGLCFPLASSELRVQWEAYGVEPPLLSLLCQERVPAPKMRSWVPRNFQELAQEENLQQLYGPAAQGLLKVALRRLWSDSAAQQPEHSSCALGQRQETAPAAATSAGQRILPVAVAHAVGAAISAEQLEKAERTKEANLLLAMLPDACHRMMLGFRVDSWAACPPARKAEFAAAHLTKFGPGSLAQARRPLHRLGRWLVLNGMAAKAETFDCESGVLIWFVLDEQRASKSAKGGGTIPGSLRTGLDFARRHCAVSVDSGADALCTISSPTSRTPVPALSVTIRMLYHFITIASATSQHGTVARVYASLFVMCCFASLRVRDAQRAALAFRASAEGEIVQGECFTSKHPKRRAPQRMPFYLPCMSEVFGDWAMPARQLHAALPRRDYLFPAVRRPRAAPVLDPRAELVATPAK